ncbi:MAG: Ig-like domain-containing protein [Muribaculaceae bacterium]|nr:Ig-like domain-containing protein [Muribaculaceae bacterium]
MKSFKYIALAALATAGLTACDDEKQLTLNADQGHMLEEITLHVSPTLPLAVGMDSTLTWTVGPENASNKNVIFSSDNEEVATVSPDGTIHAKDVGRAIITAYGEIGFPVFDAHATVIVNVIPEIIKATEIIVTNTTPAGEDGKIYVTDELQMAVEILPADHTYDRVVWGTTDPEVATVDENGLVTCCGMGDVTIYAAATDKSNVRGEITIHVNRMVDADRVEIAPLAESLCINQGSVELDVTYYPADATVGSVIWESDDEMVATVYRGVVTPRGFGTANITATCSATGEKATIQVTVENGLYIWNARNQWAGWICSSAEGGEERGDTWRVVLNLDNKNKWRRDIKMDVNNNNMFTMASARPVLAIKCTIPKGGNNTWDVRDSGNPKDNNGFDLPDGTRLIMIDLTAKFGEWATNTHDFNLWQLKAADIPQDNVDPAKAYYDVYWIRTFRSADEAQAFATAEASN